MDGNIKMIRSRCMCRLDYTRSENRIGHSLIIPQLVRTKVGADHHASWTLSVWITANDRADRTEGMENLLTPPQEKSSIFCISYVRAANSVCSTMPQLSQSEKTNWILQNNFRNRLIALDLSSTRRGEWPDLYSSPVSPLLPNRFVRPLYSSLRHRHRFDAMFCLRLRSVPWICAMQSYL